MRDYGKVAPTFWTGETGKAIRKCGPEAVIVALYLMTSPTSNMLGLYYQPVLYMAHETGLGLEGASKGLSDCIKVGFCLYDEPTEMVWAIEMAAFQIAEELKVSDNRCAGIQKEYDSLPTNPFLSDFFDHYRTKFHLTRRRGVEGASKPLPSQEQEQEHKQDQEQEQKKTGSSAPAAADPSAPDQKLVLTPPGTGDELKERKAERLRQVTDDAIAAFNARLGKPNGLLPSVSTRVGKEKRQENVKRVLRLARQMCEELYGAPTITAKFWTDYFADCARDPFLSGQQEPGKGHENWKPSFEYLTREDTMLKVFDKASAEAAA